MNAITSAGISIDTPAETLDKFLEGTDAYPGMKRIYGENINVNPNSPDGQFINLGVLITQDILALIVSAYASFDPDQAVGRALDQRCAINGVIRNAGTYTYTNVTVTATQAVTLEGLDTSPDAPFTVSDAAGNKFVLVEQYAFVGAASTALAFRALDMGAVETLVNTITVIDTITLGISTVNNPAVATTTGTAEETDAALRIRRARSVALPSTGFFDGLVGALLAVDGVGQVKLVENTTNADETYGAKTLPGHSIWAIVSGGEAADIAQAIYVKRNAGCGMLGDISTNITQVDGSLFAVLFDRPISQDLWIRASVHPITGTVDTAFLKTELLAALDYDIGQSASSSEIVSLLQGIAVEAGMDVAISIEGVSLDGVTWASLVDTTEINYQFAAASARTTITEI